MNSLRASIIISTWNGRHLLETCLPRVLRAVEEAGGDHEVIVVDDASRDDTVEHVKREFPQVRLLALKHNLRFAGANNAAARIAKGEFLVFLNNDMLVEPDFLEPLLRPFRDPAVFAVTAHIHMQPKHVGGHQIRETGLVRARFEDGMFVLRHDDPTGEEPVPVIYAGGGSSAWRRDRFFELGAFDTLFRPFYFEDLDVSYRAQKAGWRVLFVPTSHVTHQHRQTNNPDNFPASYIERMFWKNTLLFTWKVLTDQPLVNAHFWKLWHLLMRPRLHLHISSWFLRAAVQLPKLLVRKHRSRSLITLSDGEVLPREALAGQVVPAGLAAVDAGPAPCHSSGSGKRILVLGFSPLPFERERHLDSLCCRTWHVVQALVMDGHEVTVVGCRSAGAYRQEGSRPPVLRFQGRHFAYYSVERGLFETVPFLQQVLDETRPEAVVAVHSHCAWVAARLNTDAPVWADLSEESMALAGERATAAQAWERERAALIRADAFSVASLRQRHALIGKLAAVGRLQGGSQRRDFVHYLPTAIESIPYRHLGQALRGKLPAGPGLTEDDFVVLWSGRYRAENDLDTLFEGLAAAMREDHRIKFVSLGGPSGGASDAAFYRFRERVEEAQLSDRFIFVGWVPAEDVPNYYFESDVGISIDQAGFETELASRCRIPDMFRAGLPVVTTLGSEISESVRAERLGLTVEPGDSEGLKQAIVTLARDESLRRRCGERAKQWVFRHRTLEQVMTPLREWAASPGRSADRGAGWTEAAPGWFPRGFCARLLRLWETQGGRAALRTVARRLVSFSADTLSRAFILRRASAPWGLDPREPPHKALVIRAGPLTLTREAVNQMRGRYPTAEITVLAPEPLAAETRYETGAPVTSAPGAGLVSYRVTKGLVRDLHDGDYDTVVVAGEGNRRAELVAIVAGLMRRVEVRADGAAHTFWVAPYKPLLLLLRLLVGMVEKLTLTLVLGLVWSSLWLEGQMWRLQQAAGARFSPPSRPK